MGHHHHPPPKGYNTTFRVTMALNGGLALTQLLVAWKKAQSTALFTDAVHNLTDVVSLGIPWVVISRLAKQTEEDEGSQKFQARMLFANYALLLMSMIWAIIESFRRLLDPQDVSGEIVGTMGAISIVVNLFSAWLLHRGSGNNPHMRAAMVHQASDALLSVGVVIAGFVTAWTGIMRLDSVAAILISLVISHAILKKGGGFNDSWQRLRGRTPAECHDDHHHH